MFRCLLGIVVAMFVFVGCTSKAPPETVTLNIEIPQALVDKVVKEKRLKEPTVDIDHARLKQLLETTSIKYRKVTGELPQLNTDEQIDHLLEEGWLSNDGCGYKFHRGFYNLLSDIETRGEEAVKEALERK